jgi:hypothetical protein
MLRLVLACGLLASGAGCFSRASDQFACTPGGDDCDPGRVCEQGFCVVVDAPVDQAVVIDTPPDARACTGGNAHAEDGNGACFVFFLAPLNRTSAEAACVGLDMHLASIHSAASNTVVQNLISNKITWLGATDAVTEGTFVWGDGTPFDFQNFRAGEPNNGAGLGQEDCLTIEGNMGGTWDDQPCGVAFSYVCGF